MVKFGDTEADVISATETEIVANVPAGNTAGVIDVSVFVQGVGFAYPATQFLQALHVTQIVPSSGKKFYYIPYND